MGRGVLLVVLGLVSVLVLALSPAASGGAQASKSLIVSNVGKGIGTVSSQPKGISCGSTCSHAFAYGATVLLKASPRVGTRFVGWSGACSGTHVCELQMIQAQKVTAYFKRAWANLKVTKAGSGSGKVYSPTHAIDCGSTCSRLFGYGATVLLKAAHASGSRFAGWLGACSGTAPCKLTLTAAKTVRATFVKR